LERVEDELVLPMYLISHPTGNQNSRQAALALAERRQLGVFLTALKIPQRVENLLVGNPLGAALQRRGFSPIDEHVRGVAAIRESTRLLAPRIGLPRLRAHEKGWASTDKVYAAVDRAAARRTTSDSTLSATYCYEDGAQKTFEAAAAKGMRRVYELPIGYWRAHRRLCSAEAGAQPRWSGTWMASADSDDKLARKDAEIALATDIIVPSRFVADTLNEYPGKLPRVHVVNYGSPTALSATARRWYEGGTLKLLFVGGLSQRKGLSYLLDAIRPLKAKVELTVIGTGNAAKLVQGHCETRGSLPHPAVLQAMREHDVFVFPSLFEGYSLAVAEAMSQGLPVITTPNSGTADIITNGVEGWIVPIRNAEQITAHLESYLQEPAMVRRMGLAALDVANSHSWGGYRELLSARLGLAEGQA
jgi:starch synthase